MSAAKRRVHRGGRAPRRHQRRPRAGAAERGEGEREGDAAPGDRARVEGAEGDRPAVVRARFSRSPERPAAARNPEERAVDQREGHEREGDHVTRPRARPSRRASAPRAARKAPS